MKSTLILTTAAAALGLSLAAMPAAASVVVPSSGSSSYDIEFFTDGAPIALIDGAAESEFSLTLAVASDVTYSILDCCIIGDTYDAVIDGSVTAWDTESGLPGSSFLGTLTTTLGPGSYTFGAIIDASGSGFALPAGATASFDIVASQIPVPAAGFLLIGGLGGLAALRRRKTS